MIPIISVSLCFLAFIISPQVSGSRLPSSSSSDESLKSLEGQLLGNSLLTPVTDRQQSEPRLSYYDDPAAVDTLQKEYDEARAYEQLINALQEQLMWGQIQQQQHDPPIRVVQRSRILYPEDQASENSIATSRRLNSNRRFPPPPTTTTGGIHKNARGSKHHQQQQNSGSFFQSTTGHEQQKRPESPQRLISGSGVSGLANFLTQSYGLGKDGSIGVRFGLS